MKGEGGEGKADLVSVDLRTLAKEKGEDLQLLMIRYGMERLLYRLGRSEHRDRFVLKGAMLFMLWRNRPHRPTYDIDFLGFGDGNEAGIKKIFQDICRMPVEDDGLIWMSDSVRILTIRKEMEYGGIRVKLFGKLARARIPIQVDIGFGDAVAPDAKETEFPTLLGDPAPRLRAYPKEAVVAEKYQALVSLALPNTRMKDFYDMWIIAREFDFDGMVFSHAIRNTFSRRRTPLPERKPAGLSARFYEDARKNDQWRNFLRKRNLAVAPPPLADVCRFLDTFLSPPTQALARGEEFSAKWKAGGPWK